MSRRLFLKASGGTAALALGTGATAVTWHQLSQSAATRPLPTSGPVTGSRVLVIVSMYGGNDGLNTVVPYADSAYHAARTDLGFSADEVLKLDSALGLNPAMTGMAKRFEAGKLAIVRGVGYPKPDRSHFRSMDIWQTASPDTPVRTGWIGRWLDATGDDPLRALNIGTTLPPLAVGARVAAAALDAGNTRTVPATFATAMTALGRSDPSDTPSHAMVCAGYQAERRVASTFGPVTAANASGTSTDQQSSAGSAGGQGGLAEQLDLVGRCVKAGVPTRVYSVSLGGFDTHADEKDTQKAQLGILDTAVTRFLDDMATDPRGRNVVLLAYSEFGRRVQANAAQGTDHGTAGPVFLGGVPVKGGFYGAQPSLTDLDQGDLKADVDFRAVYGELLSDVLGSDPAQVLGSTRPKVGFLI